MDVWEVLMLAQRVAAEAPAAELPSFLGGLEAARAAAWARLATPTPRAEPEQQPAEWITPERAAEIAGVPVRRIYDWARGQRWASRPSKRCLRISERGFRRWLEVGRVDHEARLMRRSAGAEGDVRRGRGEGRIFRPTYRDKQTGSCAAADVGDPLDGSKAGAHRAHREA
jgi:hypothetical protein